MLVLYAVLAMVVKITEGASGASDTASFKGQYCTDPRTMRKHAAYSEWADAYSCTRHRCQPGGRNLAIYTVGCKRVEAPESAIECEEVVEDTNMQFPYCCTRLRCLVVVRGEVWTRVLGQPWETLPAAPWSHMYKMKKPPPGESFLPKLGEGPVYELQNDKDGDDGSDKKSRKCEGPDCDGPVVPPPVKGHPDIVIALSTDADKNKYKSDSSMPSSRFKVAKKSQGNSLFDHDEAPLSPRIQPEEPEEMILEKEKMEKSSDEKNYYNNYDGGQRPPKILHQQAAWTEIPPNQWNEPGAEDDNTQIPSKLDNHHDSGEPLKKEEKPTHLQALVDAIGTRMKDIEGVVQRMSDKVHQGKPGEPEANSIEKAELGERRSVATRQKKPNPNGDQYQRFINRNKVSKYLHPLEGTTEAPIFGADENNLNGYFSDVSNAMLQRKQTKELPAPMYMAPVENPRKPKLPVASGEGGKRRKKHLHKRKHSKGHHKKHHAKDEKVKRSSKPSANSVETDIRNINSAEDNQFPREETNTR